MQEGITERIVGYVLHDAIANTEGYIAEYDTAKLQHAEDSGAIFIAVYDSGRRERVKAADIVDPTVNFQVVAPRYVDERMVAVAVVFDALAAEMSGGVSLMSADAAGAAAPPTFAEALAMFKELVYGDAQ